jgi:flagellar FliJ protein
MKFKFPLQKVLEHRKVIEDIAQKDFQEALSAKVKEERLLEIMLEKMHEAYNEAFLRQHSKSGSTSDRLQQIHDFILGQKVRIERQKAKIQECDKLVEAYREILREKAVEYKIIERLRERKKEEFTQEEARNEQKEMDEISVLRKAHGRRA